MNIRVDLTTPITDGTEVVFRSPVDCSQVTGLKVYYTENGVSASKEFAFADAHGNNVGDIDHLFAENVVVKVILDVTTGMAFVQNADTNAYIERTFIKTVNGIAPDENGNVNVDGVSAEEKELILSLFRNAAYTADMSATFAQLAELWGIEVPDEPVVPDEPDVPVEPEEPDVPVVTLTSISATYSGGDVPVGTAVTDLTGIVVTAHYSDGTSKAVTDYTLSGTIAEGSNTITVSYGGKSTTFAVTGVAEEEPESTEPVYQIAEAITFNKDKVVDTGYKLLDVDKSWSVCVDHNDAARGGNVWDASPNASQGLALTSRGGYFRTLMVAGSLYKDIGTVVGNYKTIVTHTKNTDVVNYYFVLPSTTNLVSGEITYTKYLTDSNIISGGARTVKLGGRYDGTTADYNGTINRFEIYERVLSEAEIYAFAGAEVPEGVTDYVTIPCTVPTDNIVAGEINDAGAIAEKATAYVADSYIKVTAGGSYVVDATEFFAVQAYDTWVECAWYDSSGIYISQDIKKLTTADKTMTVTALGNAEYMKVGISCDTATADNASTYFSHISISEVK